jgi:hypothetical protein
MKIHDSEMAEEERIVETWEMYLLIHPPLQQQQQQQQQQVASEPPPLQSLFWGMDSPHHLVSEKIRQSWRSLSGKK